MFTKVESVQVRFTRSLDKNFVFPCSTNITHIFLSYNGVTTWKALSQEIKGTAIYHKFTHVVKDSQLISYV